MSSNVACSKFNLINHSESYVILADMYLSKDKNYVS